MSFKSARLAAGMTLTKAAESIGVSKAAVSIWESGKGRPLAENLVKLAELYNCSLEELLRKED